MYQAYKNDKSVNLKDNVECLVIKTYDKRLICNVDDKIYGLQNYQKSKKYQKTLILNQKQEKNHVVFSA